MKKKELLNLIKSKSEAISLPDFSDAIINKAKHLPKPEVMEKRHGLRLKPYYLATLSLMLTTLLIVLFTPGTPINPVDPNPSLENMDAVLAFSTLTSVSLIQALDTDLDVSTEDTSLSHGNPPRERRIDAQIPNIAQYLEMMEKLFGSESNFNLELETATNPLYEKRMRFKTKDLLDTEEEYAIDFNQTSIGVHDFLIEGVILIGTYAYPVYATGTSNDEDTLNLIIDQGNGRKVEISYVKDEDLHVFDISIYQDDVQIQEVGFTYKQDGLDKEATLHFIQGEATGHYTFALDVEDGIKRIRITYDLDSDDPESGEILIRIRTLAGVTSYIILVKPDGGIPFVIQRQRPMRPGMGGPIISGNSAEL